MRRWKFQEYNCGIEHNAGVYNFVADDFSRMIPPDVREEVATSLYSLSVITLPLDQDLSNPAPNISKYDVINDNTFSAQDTW